eukprot:gene6817-10447_t
MDAVQEALQYVEKVGQKYANDEVETPAVADIRLRLKTERNRTAEAVSEMKHDAAVSEVHEFLNQRDYLAAAIASDTIPLVHEHARRRHAFRKATDALAALAPKQARYHRKITDRTHEVLDCIDDELEHERRLSEAVKSITADYAPVAAPPRTRRRYKPPSPHQSRQEAVAKTLPYAHAPPPTTPPPPAPQQQANAPALLYSQRTTIRTPVSNSPSTPVDAHHHRHEPIPTTAPPSPAYVKPASYLQESRPIATADDTPMHEQTASSGGVLETTVRSDREVAQEASKVTNLEVTGSLATNTLNGNSACDLGASDNGLVEVEMTRVESVLVGTDPFDSTRKLGASSARPAAGSSKQELARSSSAYPLAQSSNSFQISTITESQLPTPHIFSHLASQQHSRLKTRPPPLQPPSQSSPLHPQDDPALTRWSISDLQISPQNNLLRTPTTGHLHEPFVKTPVSVRHGLSVPKLTTSPPPAQPLIQPLSLTPPHTLPDDPGWSISDFQISPQNNHLNTPPMARVSSSQHLGVPFYPPASTPLPPAASSLPEKPPSDPSFVSSAEKSVDNPDTFSWTLGRSQKAAHPAAEQESLAASTPTSIEYAFHQAEPTGVPFEPPEKHFAFPSTSSTAASALSAASGAPTAKQQAAPPKPRYPMPSAPPSPAMLENDGNPFKEPPKELSLQPPFKSDSELARRSGQGGAAPDSLPAEPRGRRQQQQQQQGATASSRPVEIPHTGAQNSLPDGTAVVLHSFVQEAEYNGSSAVVLGRRSVNGYPYVLVQVDRDGKKKLVKERNTAKITDPRPRTSKPARVGETPALPRASSPQRGGAVEEESVWWSDEGGDAATGLHTAFSSQSPPRARGTPQPQGGRRGWTASKQSSDSARSIRTGNHPEDSWEDHPAAAAGPPAQRQQPKKRPRNPRRPPPGDAPRSEPRTDDESWSEGAEEEGEEEGERQPPPRSRRQPPPRAQRHARQTRPASDRGSDAGNPPRVAETETGSQQGNPRAAAAAVEEEELWDTDDTDQPSPRRRPSEAASQGSGSMLMSSGSYRKQAPPSSDAVPQAPEPQQGPRRASNATSSTQRHRAARQPTKWSTFNLANPAGVQQEPIRRSAGSKSTESRASAADPSDHPDTVAQDSPSSDAPVVRRSSGSVTELRRNFEKAARRPPPEKSPRRPSPTPSDSTTPPPPREAPGRASVLSDARRNLRSRRPSDPSEPTAVERSAPQDTASHAAATNPQRVGLAEPGDGSASRAPTWQKSTGGTAEDAGVAVGPHETLQGAGDPHGQNLGEGGRTVSATGGEEREAPSTGIRGPPPAGAEPRQEGAQATRTVSQLQARFGGTGQPGAQQYALSELSLDSGFGMPQQRKPLSAKHTAPAALPGAAQGRTPTASAAKTDPLHSARRGVSTPDHNSPAPAMPAGKSRASPATPQTSFPAQAPSAEVFATKGGAVVGRADATKPGGNPIEPADQPQRRDAASDRDAREDEPSKEPGGKKVSLVQARIAALGGQEEAANDSRPGRQPVQAASKSPALQQGREANPDSAGPPSPSGHANEASQPPKADSFFTRATSRPSAAKESGKEALAAGGARDNTIHAGSDPAADKSSTAVLAARPSRTETVVDHPCSTRNNAEGKGEPRHGSTLKAQLPSTGSSSNNPVLSSKEGTRRESPKSRGRNKVAKQPGAGGDSDSSWSDDSNGEGGPAKTSPLQQLEVDVPVSSRVRVAAFDRDPALVGRTVEVTGHRSIGAKPMLVVRTASGKSVLVAPSAVNSAEPETPPEKAGPRPSSESLLPAQGRNRAEQTQRPLGNPSSAAAAAPIVTAERIPSAEHPRPTSEASVPPPSAVSAPSRQATKPRQVPAGVDAPGCSSQPASNEASPAESRKLPGRIPSSDHPRGKASANAGADDVANTSVSSAAPESHRSTTSVPGRTGRRPLAEQSPVGGTLVNKSSLEKPAETPTRSSGEAKRRPSDEQPQSGASTARKPFEKPAEASTRSDAGVREPRPRPSDEQLHSGASATRKPSFEKPKEAQTRSDAGIHDTKPRPSDEQLQSGSSASRKASLEKPTEVQTRTGAGVHETKRRPSDEQPHSGTSTASTAHKSSFEKPTEASTRSGAGVRETKRRPSDGQPPSSSSTAAGGRGTEHVKPEQSALGTLPKPAAPPAAATAEGRPRTTSGSSRTKEAAPQIANKRSDPTQQASTPAQGKEKAGAVRAGTKNGDENSQKTNSEQTAAGSAVQPLNREKATVVEPHPRRRDSTAAEPTSERSTQSGAKPASDASAPPNLEQRSTGSTRNGGEDPSFPVVETPPATEMNDSRRMSASFQHHFVKRNFAAFEEEEKDAAKEFVPGSKVIIDVAPDTHPALKGSTAKVVALAGDGKLLVVDAGRDDGEPFKMCPSSVSLISLPHNILDEEFSEDDAAEAEPAEKPPPSLLPKGTPVVLHSLLQCPQLNGATTHVLDHQKTAAGEWCYVVSIGGFTGPQQQQQQLLRPDNVRAIQPGAAEAPRVDVQLAAEPNPGFEQRYPIGSSATLQNFQSRQQLNGTAVEITGHRQASGETMVAVRMPDGKQTLVRESNLQLGAPSESSGEGGLEDRYPVGTESTLCNFDAKTALNDTRVTVTGHKDVSGEQMLVVRMPNGKQQLVREANVVTPSLADTSKTNPQTDHLAPKSSQRGLRVSAQSPVSPSQTDPSQQPSVSSQPSQPSKPVKKEEPQEEDEDSNAPSDDDGCLQLADALPPGTKVVTCGFPFGFLNGKRAVVESTRRTLDDKIGVVVCYRDTRERQMVPKKHLKVIELPQPPPQAPPQEPKEGQLHDDDDDEDEMIDEEEEEEEEEDAPKGETEEKKAAAKEEEQGSSSESGPDTPPEQSVCPPKGCLVQVSGVPKSSPYAGLVGVVSSGKQAKGKKRHPEKSSVFVSVQFSSTIAHNFKPKHLKLLLERPGGPASPFVKNCVVRIKDEVPEIGGRAGKVVQVHQHLNKLIVLLDKQEHVVVDSDRTQMIAPPRKPSIGESFPLGTVVQTCGMTKEFNGLVGEVIQLNPKADTATVLLQNGKKKAIPQGNLKAYSATEEYQAPPPTCYPVGTRVLISGLTGAKELNGKKGVVKGFNQDDDRLWCMLTEVDDEKERLFRPPNLSIPKADLRRGGAGAPPGCYPIGCKVKITDTQDEGTKGLKGKVGTVGGHRIIDGDPIMQVDMNEPGPDGEPLTLVKPKNITLALQ